MKAFYPGIVLALAGTLFSVCASSQPRGDQGKQRGPWGGPCLTFYVSLVSHHKTIGFLFCSSGALSRRSTLGRLLLWNVQTVGSPLEGLAERNERRQQNRVVARGIPR